MIIRQKEYWSSPFEKEKLCIRLAGSVLEREGVASL